MELIRDTWSGNEYKEFIEYLKSIGEESYKKFNMRLIPDTPNIIGIRVPILRKIAKKISKGNWKEYLETKKSNLHEEIIIEGFVIANLKIEYSELVKYIKSFADKIYNWAICDSASFKAIKNNKREFWAEIDNYLKSENVWHQRFGIISILGFYLDDEYIEKSLKRLDEVNSDFYYVQMAMAWTIATAFGKYRDITLNYLHNANINYVTFNMTIKKIRESNRVSKEDKEMVLKLKK